MRFARFALSLIASVTFVGLTSCSDPVPPTPQGAWYVSLQKPATNPSQCLIAGHDTLVGSVTASKKDQLIPDGVNDAGPSAEVECSVVPKNGKFDVHGKMSSEGSGLEINITGMPKAATEDAPINGTAAYAAAPTGGNPYQSTPKAPCQFYFTPNTSEGVDAGKVWVSFKCPTFTDAGSMSTCELKQGYAIFENCTQAASE